MTILVMGDEQNFHAAVSETVKKNGRISHHAETAVVAGSYFDSIKPGLVVFCYDSVEKSEVGLKALYTHAESVAGADFKTLLLCSKNETAKAFGLCLDHVFDDYIIAKPLQDNTQLEWRIQSLLSSQDGNSQSLIHQLWSQLESIKDKLTESHDEVINPDSQANKNASEKLTMLLDELGNAMRQNITPIISESFDEMSQSQKEHELTHRLESSMGTFAGSFNHFMDSLIVNLLQHYGVVETELNKTFQLLDSAAAPSIMVVDDNSGFREPVVQILSDEGYKVIASDAGSKAVGMIIREIPELVLIDYQMPSMDGLETIKQVRELLNGTRSPRFIMVTGNSSEEVVKQARTLGVSGFLVKPVRRLELLEKVKANLRKRSALS